MATPQGAVPQDLIQAFKDLDRRVRDLTAASLRRQQLNVTEGDFVVTGGDIVLRDSDEVIVWRASQDPVKTYGNYDSVSSMNAPATWTDYGGTGVLSVEIPKGYRSGHFIMNVSTGATFGTTGNVSVQPWLEADSSGKNRGPAIASSNSSVSVASSFWARNVQNLDQFSQLNFGVSATSQGTPTAGSGNWHCAFSLILRRGPL